MFEKAQLIADGTEHMVLSTQNHCTLSTERTISVVHRFTSVNKIFVAHVTKMAKLMK